MLAQARFQRRHPPALGQSAPNSLRPKTHFIRRFKQITPVQPSGEKYPYFAFSESMISFPPSRLA
jgi:hypothetical protein